MSEATLDPSSLQHAHMATVRHNRRSLNSLEALERGFALFRSTFAREAWRYYIASAPFILSFIALWVVNGQIRISGGILLAEAALLAGGYALRVCMVASYMRRVRERVFNTPTLQGPNLATKAAAAGRLITWKILLSLSALITIPSVAGATWFYGACQFASLEAQEDTAEKHSMTDCLALASQYFGGGLLLFLTLVPLSIAVFLNGLILAMVVPQLLHSIFGLNTLLSTEMGMFALLQSSAFWLALLAGSWIAIDPVVKCTFIVIYQHLRSRREGDDLRGLLATLPREQQKKEQMITHVARGGRVMAGALFALATILTGASLTVTARAQAPPVRSAVEATNNSAREVRIQKLRQAVDRESQRAIYRWHDSEHPTAPTWIDKLLAKMEHAIEHAWDALVKFLRKLWPRGWGLSFGNATGGGWQLKNLRIWILLILGLTVTAASVLFWLRRKKEQLSTSVPISVAPMLDMSDVVAAAERSEDEWFSLAGRLEGEGQLRLALRAAYLGLLAGLAQRKWLTIRRDRTNREYLDEFTRRWRRRPQAALEIRTEIPEKLRGSLRQFDRVWYGSHLVTSEAVSLYRLDQREFLNHV